ncbi:uncharacterized protein [Antedon mediterranea]|uniref:uncharacterized protein n=1 Tax=Antedon mediterranea TaxID=105859 RepID=UPI003AF4737B
MDNIRSKSKRKEKILALPPALKKQKIDALKVANRKRVAKFRAKKAALASDGQSPFRSAMAFAKATTRAKRMLDAGLPSSPRRRKRVRHILFNDELHDETPTSSKRRRSNETPEETIKIITTFYERDDVSRQAPGMKDYCLVQGVDGKKNKMQVRHLTSSIMETFSLFCNEFPEIKVGKSKFAEIRPKHVYLTNKLPHNVCLCRYHENFIFAVDALHKVCRTFPSYTHDFPASLLCETVTEKCWLNECSSCKDAEGFKQKYQLILDEDACENESSWYVWRMSNTDKRILKVIEQGTVKELTEYFCSLIPQFIEHCYVKRQQAATSKDDRMKASPLEAVIQIDFSENYTCVSQDEIQSAHWNQRQVSLFTIAQWFGEEVHSRVLVSDNLVHSKETVVSYIDEVLEQLPETVTFVSLWSDGPASQFKNRFIVAAIQPLQAKHKVTLRWNYFATSHGKGPVDGIGGSVKRFVWGQVRTRKTIVSDAKSFVSAAAGMKNVSVKHFSQQEIDKRNTSLNTCSIFYHACAIHGIAKMHCFDVTSSNVSAFVISRHVKEYNLTVHVGEWYQVDYDGKLYPGEVIAIGEQNDFQVSVMEQVGKYWRWPTPRDTIYYVQENLKKKVQAPVVVNNRGHFEFHNL